jgi:Tol biopolymer transport system component
MAIGAEVKKQAWSLALLFLFLAACSSVPGATSIPESPLLRILERKSGLIAYIGLDGNVYTIDQGGGRQRAVTSDALVSESEGALRFYQFPTWSWDSQQLAFISIDRSEEGDVPVATLYAASLDEDEKPVELFKSGEETPVYIYWSPDNERIAFLTASVNTNNRILRMVPVTGGESQLVDIGVPYFWAWSPDGQTMVVNAGGPVESDPNAHMAFLRLADGVSERRLELTPHRFQAPAWSPDGEHLLLAAQGDSGEGVLYLADRQGSPAREVVTFGGSVSFGWSPDGEKVAYIATDDEQAEAPGKLTVVAADGSSEAIASPEEGVLAFFWSPDNEKVAYFLLGAEESQVGDEEQQGEEQQGEQQEAVQLLVLNILDTESGATHTIANFEPSQLLLTILPVFDQYQHSATLWSPDGEYLVLSAIGEDGAPGIWVVPASGRLPPRFITQGIIAFWSWE